MSADRIESSKLTLPNLLTGFRFVAAPVLLWFAWHEYALAFMALLAIVFLSDLLDGIVARLVGQVSEFGAVLDSCADIVTYSTIALSCWWLWPDIVRREWFYLAVIIGAMMLSAVAGLVKFGRFTSYHTWAVKLAAASTGLSLYILFFGGPIWPFRCAALLCLMAGLEELLITLLLAKPASNVRSLWFVIKDIKQFTK